MSVPVLLTGLETIVPPSVPLPPPTLDDNAENYVPLTTSAPTTSRRSKYLAHLGQLPVFDEKSMCYPHYRVFVVELNMELEPNEMVAVTGNTSVLGKWEPEHAVPLRPCGHMRWSANVPMQLCEDVNYRYFTYVLDAHGNRLVRRWEAELQPREMKPCADTDNGCRLLDHFGEIKKGNVSVQRGWLTNETIVQLKFERQIMFEVQKPYEFDVRHLVMKLVPLHVNDTSVTSEDEGLCVEVAKMQYRESQLKPQPANGIDYQPGEIVIFHLTVPRKMKFAYELLFQTPAENGKLIGRALIKPEDLQGSEGELKLTVTAPEEGSREQLALLTLPYLVVQPLEGVQLDFHTTYAQYWPKSWPNLDVGHRGMGRSYITNAPEERENTIASFLRAYELHSDMIELDVHLTSDGVPVIWHDFSVKTAPVGKPVRSLNDLDVVLIKDLSYAQLKELRVFAVISNAVKEYPSHNAELRVSHRLFPRLLEVLQALPQSLGIDVEIKWPQRIAGGGAEAEQTIDKNFFVDRILQTVLQHGCGRPLIFSSFDADICTMLRFKQNLLPVMFLTQGETKKWKPFLDLRTRNFEQAVNFAQTLELVGTAPHAEDFVGEKGAQLMKLAHNLHQIAVVWGDDCNSRESVRYFRKLGAAGICYDRLDLNLAVEKNSSFFSTISTQQLFKGQCKNKN